ncbi:MAG TPA: response regulator, partial [Longimicrobium sp.]|nr:response regulator [Longimicrobium sp.]
MSGAPPRLLVADDDPAIRKALGIILAAYDVREAGDGAEALRLVASARPDAMVLDVVMPEVGGLEVCRELRSTGDD